MTFSINVIPMITAPISIISSSCIIIIISRSKEKMSHMYHRIMTGFSITDIILSSAMSISSIPSPKDSGLWNAIGNISTCNAQGSLFMFGSSAAPLYFLSLQLYYLCVITFKMNVEQINKIEPFLHGVPILFGLTSACVPLITDSINPSKAWCWIADNPLGCHADPDVECTERGTSAPLQRWVFLGGPLILVLILSSLAMAMIYTSVRNLDILNASHDFRYCGSNTPQTTEESQDRTSRLSITRASINSSITGIFCPVKERQLAIYRRSRKAKDRISQYFIGYLLTIIFPLLKPIVMANGGSPLNILEVLTFVFYPLQGFYNLIVFITPSIKRVRKKNTEISFPRAIFNAMKTYTGPSSMSTTRSSNPRLTSLPINLTNAVARLPVTDDAHSSTI